MSNFPSDLDDDLSLPFVNNNITEIGGEAINALRDAVFAIEQNIGLNAQGTTSSLAQRLGVAFEPNGTIKWSALTSLGLVTLPITDNQISNTAQIVESKLKLDIPTSVLDGYIKNTYKSINTALGWISVTGVKLDPHLFGSLYRHDMSQIDVAGTTGNLLLKNKHTTYRDNLSSYTVVNDINNELLYHQFADGYFAGSPTNIITNGGSTYPESYGHTSSGIYLHTSRFSTIPQTATDLQQFAEFIDNSSIFLLGTRIQNLYSNGISRISRSSSLSTGLDANGNRVDGYGQNIIPVTAAVAHLRNTGTSSTPVDDIDFGDDMIELMPSTSDKDGYAFDGKFAAVKVGDIIRINYNPSSSSTFVRFVVKEKKYIAGSQRYLVRIAGKNTAYTTTAQVRIDRPLFNNNKYGVLALSAVNNNFNEMPSLIVSQPRGGEATGIGFSPDQFDTTHYELYLELYPTGNPTGGAIALPAIDVTGNAGTTPGLYSLDSIVAATNASFRAAGYNFRFVAFSYKGEFGIMLADSYNNAAFSILTGGTYNVVDTTKDPLGFGPSGANVAGIAYQATYASSALSQNPAKVFIPLDRNNYYVNGVEKSVLNIEAGQLRDGYGDGYWIASIIGRSVLSGRIETTYSIPFDLSTSSVVPGKTLVVQSMGTGDLVNFGRFIVKGINYNCFPNNDTEIVVYDSVHAKGSSPQDTLSDGYVALYFGSDSISFNKENSSDLSTVSAFKRHFEVYTDENGNTFTHERGRALTNATSVLVNSDVLLYSSTNLAKMDIVKISPKLRGYQFGSVNKITLNMISYNATTGVYDGYLAYYDGVSFTRNGVLTFGKQGEITRFYDETNIDYVDVIFDIGASVGNISNEKIDFQLFPTLSLDDEVMLIATCQVDDATHTVSRLRDERQFGNIGEKDLSTSALNFIATPERLLHFNGVIKGFDISLSNEIISITGGTALVNGKFQNANAQTLSIPFVSELYSAIQKPINWILCINSIGELVLIPMTDFDSALGTPNDPNRLFIAYSVVSANSYAMDSTTFSNLLNNRKDLTALYVVSSVVSAGPAIASTKTDVRRFVNDQDSNIPAVVTNNNSQGNFKTFASAAAWIKLNAAYQNSIQIKGAASVATDPGFTSNFVSIVGQGTAATITFASSITMSNVNFSNLIVNFSSTATLSNVKFDNCTVIVAGAATLTSCVVNKSNITFNAAATFSSSTVPNGNRFVDGYVVCNAAFDANTISFDNCYAAITGTTTCGLQNAFVNRSTVSFANPLTSTNNKFDDCILTFNGGTFTNTFIDPSTLTVNGNIAATSTTIVDSIVNVNVFNGFNLGSNFRFENNTVNYAYTTAPANYSSSNLVNDGYGLMQSSVYASRLSNLIVRDNIFNTAMTDRVSFINLQLNSLQSIISDVDISNNKFVNSNTSTYDIRAVISIVSTFLAFPADTTWPRAPELSNVSIENNRCNHDQMILVSSVRNSTDYLNHSLLSVNNTKISNNTCGTIGFMTGSNFIYYGTASLAENRDKDEQLVISGNHCKLITNLDAIGDYVPFITAPAATLPAIGSFTIKNNAVNWIDVGIRDGFGTSGSTNLISACAIISKNRISPFTSTYLVSYTNSLGGGNPDNVGIKLKGSTITDTTSNIISENTICQKPLFKSDNTVGYNYYDAAITCITNANIIGNVVNGVVKVVGIAINPILYLPSGLGSIIVSNNNFDRNGLPISAYVLGAVAATNAVSITNNIFDSSTIDGTIETVGVNIPSAWAFRNNRNQIFYVEAPIMDSILSESNTTNVSGAFSDNTPAQPMLNSAYFRQESDGYSPPTFVIRSYAFQDPLHTTHALPSSNYLEVLDMMPSPLGDVGRGWSKRMSIDNILPDNVKVLNAKIGYFEWNEGATPSLDVTSTSPYLNVASVTMTKFKNASTYNNVSSIIDVKYNTDYATSNRDDKSRDVVITSSHIIKSSADESLLMSNTIYITVDLTNQEFVTGNSCRIGCEITQNYQRNVLLNYNHIHFLWSPVVLKCLYR